MKFFNLLDPDNAKSLALDLLSKDEVKEALEQESWRYVHTTEAIVSRRLGHLPRPGQNQSEGEDQKLLGDLKDIMSLLLDVLELDNPKACWAIAAFITRSIDLSKNRHLAFLRLIEKMNPDHAITEAILTYIAEKATRDVADTLISNDATSRHPNVICKLLANKNLNESQLVQIAIRSLGLFWPNMSGVFSGICQRVRSIRSKKAIDYFVKTKNPGFHLALLCNKNYTHKDKSIALLKKKRLCFLGEERSPSADSIAFLAIYLPELGNTLAADQIYELISQFKSGDLRFLETLDREEMRSANLATALWRWYVDNCREAYIAGHNEHSLASPYLVLRALPPGEPLADLILRDFKQRSKVLGKNLKQDLRKEDGHRIAALLVHRLRGLNQSVKLLKDTYALKSMVEAFAEREDLTDKAIREVYCIALRDRATTDLTDALLMNKRITTTRAGELQKAIMAARELAE